MSKRYPNEYVIREHIEKEFKFIQIHDNYRPNYHKSPVTSKFYSKYDALDLSLADDQLVATIKKYRDKGPKDKFSWPATENQVYGWFSTAPLVPLRKDDDRYFKGRWTWQDTQHQLKLMNDRSLKLEKFSGVPFKLQ